MSDTLIIMNRPNIFYRVLVLAFTISCFAEGIILPVYAIFVQKIGGDILDAGYAMGIFLLTDGIFTTIIHRFRWTARQRIWLMVTGWIVWLCGIFLYLFISNVFMLFLTQFLMAIGSAIADPVFDQELAEHTDKKLAESEWGMFEGSKSIFDGLAAILGAAIVAFFGFPILIYIMVVAATVSFVLILYYMQKLRAHRRKASFA